jgi:uncharacterized Zn finger protein
MICDKCGSEAVMDEKIRGKNPPVIYKCTKCSWWKRIDLYKENKNEKI